MILQALYQLAEREGLTRFVDFEPKPIAWLIRLSRDGRLIGIEGTHQQPPDTGKGKKKARPKPKEFIVPLQPQRSGPQPVPGRLVDNALFVFGLDVESKFSEEIRAERALKFRVEVKRWADGTQDEALRVVVQFLEDVESGRQKVELPAEYRAGELLTFVYDSDVDRLVSERPNVVDFWLKERHPIINTTEDDFQCLVTRKRITNVPLFRKVDLLGKTPNGAAIVSFKHPSFSSHGWEKNENAPISQLAGDTIAISLRRLASKQFIDPYNLDQYLPRRHLKLDSDTLICFWCADKTGEEFCNAFPSIMEQEPHPEDVANLYRSIWTGKAPEIDNLCAFYALMLSEVQGNARAIVRGWFESTVADTSRYLADHFNDVSIVWNSTSHEQGENPVNFPLNLLINSLSVHGDSQVPSSWITQIFQAILTGTVYPYSILQRAVERYRSEFNRQKNPIYRRSSMLLNDARAGLIKGVLNRFKRIMPTNRLYKELRKDMDPYYTEAGYNLGQLMAVLESLQEKALGDVKASIVDKYFCGALGSPKHIFTHLLGLSNNHLKKVRDDSQKRWVFFRYRPLIDELVSRFRPDLEGIPKNLNMDQQGLFVVGYHQMRKWLSMNVEERDQWNVDNSDAPRSFLWIKRQENESELKEDDK